MNHRFARDSRGAFITIALLKLGKYIKNIYLKLVSVTLTSGEKVMP